MPLSERTNIFSRMAVAFNNKNRHPLLNAYFSFKQCTPQLLEKICSDYYKSNQEAVACLFPPKNTDSSIFDQPEVAMHCFLQAWMLYCGKGNNIHNFELKTAAISIYSKPENNNKRLITIPSEVELDHVANNASPIDELEHVSLADFIEKVFSNFDPALFEQFSNHKRWPLHMAACYLDSAAFQALVSKVSAESLSREIELQERDNWTPLHSVVRFLDSISFQAIVNKVSEESLNRAIELQTRAGWTLLHMAAHYSDSSVFQTLVSKVTEESLSRAIVLQDKTDWTALHRAARYLDSSTFQVLVSKVSEESLSRAIELQARDNWTPLHMLARFLDSIAFQTLVNKVSEESLSRTIVLQNKNDWTPLHLAARYLDSSTFQALVSKLSVESLSQAIVLQNKNGWTPLQMVACYLDASAFQALVSKVSAESLNQALSQLIQNNGKLVSDGFVISIENIDFSNINLSKCQAIVTLEGSNSAKQTTLNALLTKIAQSNTVKELSEIYRKNKEGILFIHQNSASAFFSSNKNLSDKAVIFIAAIQKQINLLISNVDNGLTTQQKIEIEESFEGRIKLLNQPTVLDDNEIESGNFGDDCEDQEAESSHVPSINIS